MRPIKKNSYNDAVAALKAALRIIEKMSSQKAEAGACLWICPDGEKICIKMTPEQCEKIPGAIYVGGPCKEAIPKVKMAKE